MMCNSRTKRVGLWLLIAGLLGVVTATARDNVPENPNRFQDRFNTLNKPAVDVPNVMNRSHKVGNVWMTITNYGVFGSNFGDQWDELLEEDGTPAPSFEFPAGSGSNYLYAGAVWFGAVVGIDTLVTVGSDGWMRINEMFPAANQDGEIITRSNRKSSEFYSPDAVSELDYIANYYDTLAIGSLIEEDPTDGRPHKPIGIRIQQKSYSWSYDYAQDFVLLDFTIFNISEHDITSGYMGLYVDADCWNRAMPGGQDRGFRDDYSGYKLTVPSNYPGLEDTVNIAWTSDNDGDPSGGIFDYTSSIAVAGTRVVRGPWGGDEGDSVVNCGPLPLQYSFNWWTSESDTRFDWGPRDRTKPRDFGTGGQGTPAGDLNKYYIMSNNEFDYDQLFAGLDLSDTTNWVAPTNPLLAADIANGYDTRYLFSFGPLQTLEPGDSVNITIGYIGGDNFHVNADDFSSFDADRPQVFYDKLDFTDFGINAQWAAWVFDNPGVDTPEYYWDEDDSTMVATYDGCRGLYYLVECRDTLGDSIFNCDTVYYAGDGVPDFRGPPPPLPPELSFESRPETVIVRWNGRETELTPDDFTGKLDFEGYRLYMGKMNTISGMSLISSWDRRDFKRMDFNRSTGRFSQKLDPLTPDQLTEMYAEEYERQYETEFDAQEFAETFNSPYALFNDQRGVETGKPDTVFYLAPMDFNLDNEFEEHGYITQNIIQRDSLVTAIIDTETGETGRFGYYTAKIGDLRPSEPLFFSVSAFDYGNPITSLAPLESSPIANTMMAYATYSGKEVEERKLAVSVYPNPYKISDNYRGNTFEDPFHKGWSERDRAIHFINLPREATITIYTLDGDMVRELNHPDPALSDTDSHMVWDLLSRNTQAIVSGIYLFTVESEIGTQVGKLVIIK